jgi:hypothetical protein
MLNIRTLPADAAARGLASLTQVDSSAQGDLSANRAESTGDATSGGKTPKDYT